jgi:hypothetical protein
MVPVPVRIPMPPIVVALSLLGLAPFVVCGLAALGQNPDPADRMLWILIDYAALILSFTGAVHWGLGLAAAALPLPRRHTLRLALAVLPMLAGWTALVLQRMVAPWTALALLIAAYIAMMAVEARPGALAPAPGGYRWLRWGFTVVAVAMLTTVLTLRLLGQTIVF